MPHFSEKGLHKIHIPPLTILCAAFLLAYDRTVYIYLMLAAAFIHEAGHIISAILCKVKIERITLYPFGADIRLQSGLRPLKTDIFICSAGITANFMAAGVTYFWGDGMESVFFIICNLALGILNLFPVEGLDGGEMTGYALLMLTEPVKAAKISRAVSFCGIMVLWFAAVYIMLYTGGNPSLLLICCYLFAAIFLRSRETKHSGE